MASNQTCSIKGCGEVVAVKKHGLCSIHYQRWYRTGSPGPAKIRRNEKLEPFRGK